MLTSSASAYLAAHDVPRRLQAAIEQVSRERPADPIAAIGRALLSQEATSSPLPKVVSRVRFTTVQGLLADAESGALAARLAAEGIEPENRADSFAAAARRLLAAGVQPSTRASAFWVPGRIEVMGKHTDYGGGRSLLCAVNRGFAVVSADREDATCRVLASFELSGVEEEASVPLTTGGGGELPKSWARYPAVTARRLARNFGLTRGVDLALSCDLPEASGMSSSSAVIILTFLALAARNGLTSLPAFSSALPNAETLCHYLGCIENGQDCGPALPGDAGVGTFGGSEDHTAIILCEARQLAMYSFCPTRLEAKVDLPTTLVFLIAVSGATAQKGAERLKDYNDAAMLARHAAAAAAAEAPPTADATTTTSSDAPTTPPFLAAVVQAAAAELGGGRPSDEQVRALVHERIAKRDDGAFATSAAKGGEQVGAGALGRRFEQFFQESEVLVPGVAAALRKADTAALGRLVATSQQLTESHLRNTLEETEWLPKAALRLGCVAASAFGAGFGGSVWALAHAHEAEKVLEQWEAEYAAAYPQRREQARFFTMRSPGPGARSVA